MYSWIRAFLSGRRSKVVVHRSESDWLPAEYGVPQGSPLSPLLFNILIAPALSKISVGRALFADDIGLYASGKYVKSVSARLSKALRFVSKWANRWNMSFNFRKCSATVISRCRRVGKPTVWLCNRMLNVVDSFKYLGVYFDRRLSWTIHLEKIRVRAIQQLEYILSISSSYGGLVREKVVLIYKTCVRPGLEYACQVWNDANKKLKESCLDSIQHRILARALGVRKSTCRGALEVELGICPLEERRRYLTAKTYRRFDNGDNAVSKLLHKHKDGELPILHSELNSSFFLRGEALLSDTYEDDNLRKCLIREWQRQWDASQKGRWYYAMRSRVSLKPSNWSGNMPRCVNSVLAGMRLGNESLNVRLCQQRLVPSSLCECGDEETLQHYWLHCKRYEDQRELLWHTFVSVHGSGKHFSVSEILKFDCTRN